MSQMIRLNLSIVLLLLVPALALAGDSQPEVGPGFDFTFPFSVEDLQIEQNAQGYHIITFPGAIYPDGPEYWGAPALPRISRKAILGEFDAVHELQVIYVDPDTLHGNFMPIPTQPPSNSGGGQHGPDPLIYNSNVPYPNEVAEPIFCGNLRGVRLLDFHVNPIQYVGATSQLIFYRTIRFRVLTRPLDTPSAESIVQRERPARRWSRQRKEIDWIRRAVVNPTDLDILYMQALQGQNGIWDNTDLGAFNPTDMPSTDRSPVELVIITNDETRLGEVVTGMTDVFERLASWKTRSGIPSVVRTVDWIRDHYAGVDTQEQTRNFIKDAYAKWSTDWVLIGGDTDIVPSRRVIYATRPNPPSDLYYAGLDGTMNANGNQWFAEHFDDQQSDPLHDVWLGRIPADDSTQASIFIEKLFDYTLVPNEATSLPPEEYYRRTLLAAGLKSSYNWNSGSPIGNGLYSAEQVADNLPSTMHVTRFYESLNDTCIAGPVTHDCPAQLDVVAPNILPLFGP